MITRILSFIRRVIKTIAYDALPFLFVLAILLCFILQVSCNKNNAGEEMRAVWLHGGMFDREEAMAKEQIATLFDSYQSIGINHLFCYTTLPEENGLSWDYLQTLIVEGHKRNILIHPIVYPGYSVNLDEARKTHPGWLTINLAGDTLPYFNLANSGVKKYWLDKVRSLMKYNIDGIHLDYMRFPIDQQFSYDSATCTDFRKKYEYTPRGVSHDCGSMIWCEWIKWNTDHVTDLLREMKSLVDSAGKTILLGVDVFPDLPTASVMIAQDWGAWAREGLVDFLCPMLYTNNTNLFREYIRKALQDGHPVPIYPGIGISTSHNKISKDLLIREVKIVREEGCRGMSFFSGYSLTKEMIDTLGRTVFMQPSSIR